MLIVEYVTPDGLVCERFEMADGMTLNQAARTLCPDTAGKFPVPTIAFVGSTPALMSKGDWEINLADTTIQFRQLALGGGGGGGSNPLQMVFQIAIIAAAALATWYLGGSGGYLVAAGFAAEDAMLIGGMVGAGIMMLGTVLSGVLFQNKLPQGQTGAMNAEEASPTYSINASGNQARLYQVEPELFGRMKIVPDFVANTWTEFINNEQIGYFVYALGRGEYEVESLQFGETVFWRNGELLSDSGYDIQAIEFVKPGNPVTIFPDNIVTSVEVNGQQVFAPNEEEYTGYIGPYVTNPPGTTTNRISLDFVFQQGLYKSGTDGNLNWLDVYWTVEAQKIDDFGEPAGDWFTLEAIKYTANTRTPQRQTRSYYLEDGRYRVRVRRDSFHTEEKDQLFVDTLSWASMKATLPGTYTYPISCVAFSIKANNALTQAASRQFSVIATRKLPLYNRRTKTWSEPVPTRSWAAAISHVCKCEWGGALTDADIDLDTLWAIDERLQAKNWFYDSYIDGAYLVWNLICEICQSQCVIPRLVGPVLSFVEDAPNRAPVFALTPRNIMRNSFSINYATWSKDTPDDVTIEYLDADYGFQQRDVTAKLPESESKEPTSLDILGITDRNHAHKVGVAYAAHNRWQRVSVECQVEALGRLVNRGDICTVAHPRFKNTCAGAVESWNRAKLAICLKPDYAWPKTDTDGLYYERSPQIDWPKTLSRVGQYGVKTASANLVNFAGDNTIYVNTDVKSRLTVQEEPKYLALTRPDGSVWGPCKIAEIKNNVATLDSADYSTLLLQGQGDPFEWLTSGVDRQPTPWTLYDAKIYQRLMVVDSVSCQDLLHYNLKLLNYDERIYQYGDLPVPVWQGRGQLPNNGELEPPQCLRGIVETDATLTVAWLESPGSIWYEIQACTDGQSWKTIAKTAETSVLLSCDPGQVYVRVRAGNDTKMSLWASWHGDTKNVAPDVPQPRLEGQYKGAKATITWPKIPGATSYVVKLYAGNGLAFHTSRQTVNTFELTPAKQPDGPFRTVYVEVTAENENGESSPGKLTLSDPAPAPPQSLQYEINLTSIDFIAVSPQSDKVTGYYIAKGPDEYFDLGSVLEVKKASGLPYNWPDDNIGIYNYFRIAYTDAFFDAAPNMTGLSWSKVFVVKKGETNA